MSRNYYAEIYLHLIWHTKNSRPLLTPDVEAFVHHYLRGRIINTPEAFVHEVGGIETHIHMAVSIAPTIDISKFVGQLKGASAHQANKQFALRGKVLEWQDGYGVVSFGKKNLEWVQDYVRRQREHHAQGTIVGRLERCTPPEPPQPAAEPPRAAKTAEAEPQQAP